MIFRLAQPRLLLRHCLSRPLLNARLFGGRRGARGLTMVFGRGMDVETIEQKVAEYRNGEFSLKAFACALPEVPQTQVFSNADCALQHIKHYGFDYDFTLATYNKELPILIYDLAKSHLVEKLGYPSEVADLEYDPKFAIRGLHIDKETGLLIKLDQYNKIFTPIYRGRTPVTTAETVREYGGLRVSRSYVQKNLHMMKDLFALPEACLYADVLDLLIHTNQSFVPSYVVSDIRRAIGFTHETELLHKTIARNPAKFLDPNPDLVKYLMRLRSAERSVFLLTNSPFYFVDAGMRYLIGDQLQELNLPSWTHLFDVVVVNAQKPGFYHSTHKFRKMNADGSLSLQPVEAFERGEVYTGGGLDEFHRLTGYRESNVIYMGDQIYSDLVEPQRATQWKTAAIIKELSHEVTRMNELGFREDLASLLFVERLVSEAQVHPELEEIIEWLKTERSQLRIKLKHAVNGYFGSTFRTSTARTAFFYNVGRYADIYTSSVNNFLNFPVDYCFYASRSFFPHEARLSSPETIMYHYCLTNPESMMPVNRESNND